MYIFYFVIIFPWKRAGLFIWTNLDSLHPRMLCVKFGWNWPRGSGEKDFFLNFVNVYLPFHNYIPLEKSGALHLNKLEFPSPRIAMCQDWLKLATWFSTRRFLNFVNVLSLFCVIISTWKKVGPSFDKIWIPFTRECFVPSLVEISPVILEKKMKMWKVYDNYNDNDDDKGQIVIRKAQLSLRFRWA